MIIRNLNDIKEEPASHEDKKSPGSFKKILFSKKDFGEGLSLQMVNWARIPKGKSFKLHFHEDMAEIFILVSGEVLMQVGHETRRIKAGDSVVVPARLDHKMTGMGGKDVEYYVIGLSGGSNGKTVIKE